MREILHMSSIKEMPLPYLHSLKPSFQQEEIGYGYMISFSHLASAGSRPELERYNSEPATHRERQMVPYTTFDETERALSE